MPVTEGAIVRQLKVGPMGNFAYILGDRKSGEGAVIDPGFEAERIASALAAEKLKLVRIILTHSHPDHNGSVDALLGKCGSTGMIVISGPGGGGDLEIAKETSIALGGRKIGFLLTPGHTSDGICVLFEGCVFTGDTLFVGECGRTDLPGSSNSQMHSSLLEKLAKLPAKTIVYPGHDYGASPSSTIAREKETNYTLKPRTLAEFEKFMREP